MQLDNITCSIRIIKCLIVSSIEFKNEVKKNKKHRDKQVTQLHNINSEQDSMGPALQHSEHKHRQIRRIKENYFKGLLKEKHSETDMPIYFGLNVKATRRPHCSPCARTSSNTLWTIYEFLGPIINADTH